MPNLFATAFVCVCAAIVCSLTHASDRVFVDIDARSPSGRYLVTARSPDNQQTDGDGKRRPRPTFQKDFTYVCMDTDTDTLLWTRHQSRQNDQADRDGVKRAEGSPVAIFVSDEGDAVIRTHLDELICVAPDGRETVRLRLLEVAMTEADRREYVRRTTAGPFWTDLSRWTFSRIDGRRLFVIRTWWDHRIVVDVATGELIPVTDPLEAALRADDIAFVLRTLERTAGQDRGWREPTAQRWDMRTAAHMAGRLEVVGAIPHLRVLERDDTMWGTRIVLNQGELENGELDPLWSGAFELRQLAQLSLRRLDVRPAALPGSAIATRYADHSRIDYLDAPELAQPREDAAGEVREGMTAAEVARLIGYPDFVSAHRGAWEYDMDADPPYTLLVIWDARRVLEVRREAPPLWQQGNRRDHAIVR